MCELYVTCECVDVESCNLGCKVDLPMSFTALGGLPGFIWVQVCSVTALVVAIVLELL
jgi:hypothetical protein